MVLKCHTNLVRCRHFGDAPDLSDFRGGAFPRMVHFPKEPSSLEADDGPWEIRISCIIRVAVSVIAAPESTDIHVTKTKHASQLSFV